jgi:MFS family permease
MSILKSRNGILFFSGQSISLVGTWMTQAAVLWLVYQFTHSAFSLGLITFLEQVPNFFLVPITGGIIDRGDRRKILLVTQTLLLFHALALALMVFGNIVSIEALVMLSLVKGSINAFDITTRQVFIAEIVENKQELKSAISLNALIISTARFIGPGLAGLVISQASIGACFLIDSFSYLIAIRALLLVRYLPILGRAVSPWRRFLAGLRYAWATPTLRSTLVLLSAISFLGGSYPTLTPIFAQETFKGGSLVMGYLLAAAGIGSLAGSVYLTFRPSHHRLDRLLLLSTVGLGMGLVGFGQSRLFYLSLLMMFVIGLCLVLQAVICNILLQTTTLDRHRGVVMSLFTVAYIGMTPFGNLIVGRVAMLIGASSTLTINGLLCLLGFLVVRSITRQLQDVEKS